MKAKGSGAGTPKGAAADAGRAAGQYSYAPYSYAQYHHGHQQYSPYAYGGGGSSSSGGSGSRRGRRSHAHGYAPYAHAPPQRSPLQAAAQDDTDGASRVQLLMQHQHQVMAMQSEHARKMHEAGQATAEAVTAVVAGTTPAAAAAAAAKKSAATPLGADGRPLQLSDGADGKEGMAPGSVGGPPSGKQRAKSSSIEYYYQDKEQHQVDDPDTMPPLPPLPPPHQPYQPHPESQPQPQPQPYQHPPHPHYQQHHQHQPYPYPYSPYSPYSPTAGPPQHFTFAPADVEASRAAHVGGIGNAAGHNPYPSPAGAMTTGPSAPPVAVTPGGTFAPDDDAAAAIVAQMAAPAGSPSQQHGQPITPGGASNTATTGTTSIRSASGLAMTCIGGQLRLSDGTLMLATEEDGTTNYLRNVSGQTIDMVQLLLPEHIRLVRESVEVFCATESEDIEVIEDDAESADPEEEGREKADEEKVTRTTAIGQMGLRCVHCRHRNSQQTAATDATEDDAPLTAPNAVFYPTNLEDIYECVLVMAEHHFTACPHFPPKMRLVQLLEEDEKKALNNEEEEERKKAVKAFFSSAAEKMGLVNNPEDPEGWGIRYGPSMDASTPKEVDPKASSTEEETAAEVADAVAIACAFGADVDAGAAEVDEGGDKESDTSKEEASTKAPGSPTPPRLRSMRREIRRRRPISMILQDKLPAGHVSVLGTGACRPLLNPRAKTRDHYLGDDVEALQLAEPPPYESILNFPQGRRKQRYCDERLCVMCGLYFPTTSRASPSYDGKKKRAGNLRSARKGGATTIPSQNRGVCTNCDLVVWIHVPTGYQLKFCKGWLLRSFS